MGHHKKHHQEQQPEQEQDKDVVAFIEEGMHRPSSSTSAATPAESDDRIELMNDEGDLTDKFYAVLGDVYKRFTPPSHKEWDMAALDKFAIHLNGSPFPAAQKKELREFLQCTKDGSLKFNGFVGMYELQLGSDLEETWSDLKKLGYNSQLELEDK